MSAPVVEPSACTWCGIARRGHGRQFADAVGWHKWAAPSDAQVLARMKARRLAVTVARQGAVPVPVGPESESLPRQALPWAHVMPDGDLRLFLDDLVSAAMGRWRSDPEVPDRQVLADIEKACADWRTPGQGYRSDPEPGPSVEVSVDKLTRFFAPTQALRDDEPAEVFVPCTERERGGC